jgi:L-rhamnose mutarotase
MARYLVLWRRNPVAPWPKDLAESAKLHEVMWASIDNLMKKDEIKEFGWFLDGASGYSIGEGEPATVLRNVSMFMPYIECEIHEIIPHEKAKETMRALWQELAKH